MTLERYKDRIKYEDYLTVRGSQYQTLVDLDFWQSYINDRKKLVLPVVSERQLSFGETITVDGPIDPNEKKRLEQLVEFLLPWRKGPFNLFGIEIDSEWKSDLKWNRIAQSLGVLRGKRIADFGCNNGYYMFRMAPHEPELVLGIDPNGRFYYQFELLNSLFAQPNLIFEPLGVEHASLFPNFFDLVLCMGVIYHRRDPLNTLSEIFASLRGGGRLIMESITVPGDEQYCLIPEDRYAMMRNVWFVPSVDCLCAWLRETGFKNVECTHSAQTTHMEQRQTKLAPFDSLSNFLDPIDPSRTIEGYPAPVRSIIVADKL